MADEGTTTRKLVRQEWKPLAGSRVVRFVAMSAGYALPDREWTDDLHARSQVANEVIGYAELESGRKFPGCEDLAEFVSKLDAEADMVMFRGEWADRADRVREGFAEEDAESGLRDEETASDPDPSDEDDAPEEAAEEASEDDEDEGPRPVEDQEQIVVSDGAGGREYVAYDADDEPYHLPRDATVEDMRMGVVYQAVIVDIKGYGFFISVCDTEKEGRTDVSGLVHRSNLGLQDPRDFAIGEKVTVEVEDMTNPDEVSFIPHSSESLEGLDNLFPSNND